MIFAGQIWFGTVLRVTCGWLDCFQNKRCKKLVVKIKTKKTKITNLLAFWRDYKTQNQKWRLRVSHTSIGASSRLDCICHSWKLLPVCRRKSLYQFDLWLVDTSRAYEIEVKIRCKSRGILLLGEARDGIIVVADANAEKEGTHSLND